MDTDIVTTKIKRESLRKLKILAAFKQETMLSILAHLIEAEFEKTLKEKS
jgi:hypothetical protein